MNNLELAALTTATINTDIEPLAEHNRMAVKLGQQRRRPWGEVHVPRKDTADAAPVVRKKIGEAQRLNKSQGRKARQQELARLMRKADAKTPMAMFAKRKAS